MTMSNCRHTQGRPQAALVTLRELNVLPLQPDAHSMAKAVSYPCSFVCLCDNVFFKQDTWFADLGDVLVTVGTTICWYGASFTITYSTRCVHCNAMRVPIV